MNRSEWLKYLQFAEHENILPGELGRTRLQKHFGLSERKARGVAFALKHMDVIDGKEHPALPLDHVMGKTTRHVRYKDGIAQEIVQEWIRSSPEAKSLEQIFKLLEDRTPILSKAFEPPKNPNKDKLLEWLLMDHHLGMHSWAKETGEDYDIKLASRLIVSAAEKIFAQHGQVAKAVIVLGGDNLHADNRSATTEKSAHRLDVDSRYPKALDAIYFSMFAAIDIALSFATEVEVIVLSGNHDYHSAIALARILAAHYRNEPRVKINTSPAKHKFVVWGSSAMMYTHGDTGGNIRPATYLMNWIIDNSLPDIKHKLVRKGHLHKRNRTVPPGLTEEDGVIVELFPTLAAHDSFAHDGCYSSQRATTANLFHFKYGPGGRRDLGVRELLEE